jgi:Ser/Thr protein kinase RdoA (MazF antagonist)
VPTTTPFPAINSVLAPSALAALLTEHYDLGPGLRVTFLQRGLNDTYAVEWGSERAILRVYRSGWRSPAEVRWELALIEQAGNNGVSVARPIPRRDGAFTAELHALEGPRSYALFEFAPGRSPKANPDEAALYGHAAAHLHNAAEGWTQAGRFSLDLAHLISEPMERIRPLLTHAPELLGSLEAAATRTHAALSERAASLEWGACHGDLHEGNAHIDESGTLRQFDFDCGGPGFRAYDLAVYRWSQASNDSKTPEQEAATWTAFLDAYQAIRPLAAADLDAIPLFVTARAIWFMGLYAQLAEVFGASMATEQFFQYGLDFMTGWETKGAAPTELLD